MRVTFSHAIGSSGVYRMSGWNIDDVELLTDVAMLCPGDYDGSQVVNIDDLLSVLDTFNNGTDIDALLNVLDH